MPGPGKIPGAIPPANLLKINAYKKVQETYDDAVKILKDKHLVYGEPGVVEFKFKGKNELLFGIGTIDGGLYLQSKIIDEGYIRDASTGEYISINNLAPILKEAIEVIGGLEGRIESIEAKNAAQDSSIAAAVRKANNADKAVKAMSAKVDAIDASVAYISERFAPIDASFASMAEKLAELDSSVGSMWSSVEILTSEVAAISAHSAVTDASISMIDGSIADLYEKISSIPESIGEITDASIDAAITEICN